MIYKQCVMTITKNSATLDEDIYLYRLDKNIELYFTIVNNKYKFDKSDLNNIIAQTQAAYFQVRLYKKDDIKYSFAIQPTDGGKAILKITDDLIDDPIEIGDYDFQISLLDADKTSMISMPIVSKQLHVCEPLISDQSITGVALLGLSKTVTGEIKNAFDENGNYVREIHNNGEVITAELFNKWEEALDSNTKAIKNQDIPHTISSKVLATVPASNVTLDEYITVNNVSINKDRRYYIEFLGNKKLCSLLVSEELGNCIICSIGGYTIQAFNDSTNILIYIGKINYETATDTFTDLVIYEEEVKYLDSKYLETNLVLQNSISLGRVGDIGMGSSAIGGGVTASGNGSHAEGSGTTASGESSHAEGEGTIASGSFSYAEGSGTTASGECSHAEGGGTTASGECSHVEGAYTIASSQNQHVQGKYNIEDTEGKYAHIVGNGTDEDTRSNAHTLDWQGNAWYAGKLSQEGTPTEDKDLVTKKYVDDSIPIRSFPVNDTTRTGAVVDVNNLTVSGRYVLPKRTDGKQWTNLMMRAMINDGSDKGKSLLLSGYQNYVFYVNIENKKIYCDNLRIVYSIGTTADTTYIRTEPYYLTTTNTKEYTPTNDYNPATKKYVDNIKTDINTIKTDLGSEELTTTAKDVKGAVNEVVAQYKDIAKKTVIENDKLYLVKSDGTKLDEGTTLPVSTNTITTYKCEEIGELFDQPGTNKYLAWPAGNLKYDKNIDKFVCMILACPAHIHSTSSQYVTYIDKKTYKSETPIRCKFYDTDKTTELTLADEGFCSFTILDDGNYMFVKPMNNVFYRFISEDNGKTWYKSETSNATVQFWNIIKLSNGRLIGSRDEANKGLWYSDDKGITWTNTKPSGNPGDYNAEGTVLELSKNNLMCIARKNMGGSNNGDSAIISYSTDNGTTWSEWKESISITDMNASCATGVVHDNIAEVFVCSRYGSSTIMHNNTGKFGVVNHYVATIENALKDSFTYKGTIAECKGISTNANEDFHCPCIAIDNNNELLITYYDRIYPYNTDLTNYYFIRGSLNGMLYGCYNQEGLRVKPYSGSYVDKLLKEQYKKVMAKIEQIKINGGGSSTPDTEISSYILNTATNLTYGGKGIDTGVELFKENENFTVFLDFVGNAENNLGTVLGSAYQGKIDDTSYPGFDIMIKNGQYTFSSSWGIQNLGFAKDSTERQTYAIRKNISDNTFELIKPDGTKSDYNDHPEYYNKTFNGTASLGGGNTSNWIGTIYHCEIYKVAYSDEVIKEKLNSYLN